MFKKVLIAICFAIAALGVQAHGAPKMLICMEAGYAAGEAFEMKAAKKKLVYPKVDDVIFAAFIKMAMDRGYKAKSYQAAVNAGHNSCVESKLWAEVNFE